MRSGAVRRRGARIFAASGIVLLAGCHQPGPAPPPPQPAQAILWSAPPAGARKIARPKPKPAAPRSQDTIPSEDKPENTPIPAPNTPAEPQIAAAPPGPNPEDLIGLDEQEVTGLLGPAPEIAERAPGAVWRYKVGNCELDLAFYMELRSGRMHALQYKLNNGAGATPVDACLKAIIAANRKEDRS